MDRNEAHKQAVTRRQRQKIKFYRFTTTTGETCVVQAKNITQANGKVYALHPGKCFSLVVEAEDS